jgi:DNA-binding LytR/AlgR family response regulator
MTLTCAIIDDEPLAAQLLQSYVKEISYLQLTGTYNSALTAMADLRHHPVDLLFLDIQMPELSGLEFAKLLPADTRIVFTTAFKQYAIDGYKVSAFDYLLKPISFDSFLATAEKAMQWFSRRDKEKSTYEDRFIFIKSDYKLIKVRFDDLLFIEGVKDYVKIYLDNELPPIMTLLNMKKLEESLPQPEFMRTHRSYIVHMPKVEQIDRFRIVFGDHFIPISESYKENVQRYLDSHTVG